MAATAARLEVASGLWLRQSAKEDSGRKRRARARRPSVAQTDALSLTKTAEEKNVLSQKSSSAEEAESRRGVRAPLTPALDTPPQYAARSATAFAPATVANLGPGFDFLGCAVEGLGDHVTAEVREDLPDGSLIIDSITGDGGRLKLKAKDNCIGIAAQGTLELLGYDGADGRQPYKGGIALSLKKGLPLGSGLGSSAASAAAAAVAVNALFGSPLTKAQLVPAGLKSEATVSGYHADNVAPALMGGFVLIRSYFPELELIPLVYPEDSELLFVVVSPVFEAPTRKMRAALPTEISMRSHIANSSQAAALVTAILRGDAALLGSALASDSIVEPRRAPLIPGMAAVKVAAKAAGAYGCTISGAGPTAVAVTDSLAKAEFIAQEMVKAFQEQGKLQASATLAPLNREGGRLVHIE